jgi:hypothetical protein
VVRYRQFVKFALGQVPVHWIVHFDARGEHSLRYRCKNVNLVEKTVKGVEDEQVVLVCTVTCAAMLSHAHALPHAPHPVPCICSVFAIMPIHISAKITGDDLITIPLQAAIYKRNEDEELPLTPWH